MNDTNDTKKTDMDSVLEQMVLKLAIALSKDPLTVLKAAAIGICNIEMNKRAGTLHPLGLECLEEIYKRIPVREEAEEFAANE